MKAALRLFQQRGYALVTVDDIVKEVGLTKGAFYYSFESKHDLLRDLYEEFTQLGLRRFDEAMTPDKSPREKLEAAIQQLLFGSTHMGAHFQIFFDERRHLAPGVFGRFKDRRRMIRKAIVQILQEGMRAGQFRSDLKPELVALGLSGMCSWAYHWYRPDGPEGVDSIASTFVHLVLEGLAPRASGEKLPNRRVRTGTHRASTSATARFLLGTGAASPDPESQRVPRVAASDSRMRRPSKSRLR